MVQILSSSYSYNSDFYTTSVAYLNRYPNPYAKHVLSSDTLDTAIDDHGRLHTTRLVVKTGLLPDFIKPMLGHKLDTWVIEKSIIDPKTQTVQAYSSNVDHRRFIKVEEFLTYRTEGSVTKLEVNVKFSSTFFGFKKRIEQWSRDRFHLNMNDSRKGLVYVMKRFQRPSWALTA